MASENYTQGQEEERRKERRERERERERMRRCRFQLDICPLSAFKCDTMEREREGRGRKCDTPDRLSA